MKLRLLKNQKKRNLLFLICLRKRKLHLKNKKFQMKKIPMILRLKKLKSQKKNDLYLRGWQVLKIKLYIKIRLQRMKIHFLKFRLKKVNQQRNIHPFLICLRQRKRNLYNKKTLLMKLKLKKLKAFKINKNLKKSYQLLIDQK